MYIKLGDLVERLSLFLNGLVDFEAFFSNESFISHIQISKAIINLSEA